MHIQAALAAKEALSASPGGPGAAPPPPPSAAASPGADLPPVSPGPGPAMKSEQDPRVKELESLVKSQAEDIANLTKAVTMVLEQPKRRAVTSVSYLKKTESAPEQAPVAFTPAQARAKLSAALPSLSKAELELVKGFYTGAVKAEALAPIFDKLK